MMPKSGFGGGGVGVGDGMDMPSETRSSARGVMFPRNALGKARCPLSSARKMDGPRVSVFIVMRIIGFQSSRDQVMGLTVRSQWSPLFPH